MQEDHADKIRQLFGHTMRKWRNSLNLTQQEVAMCCDMSLRFYQDLESGNKQPSLTTIFRICLAIDVSPDELITPVWNLWCDEQG